MYDFRGQEVVNRPNVFLFFPQNGLCAPHPRSQPCLLVLSWAPSIHPIILPTLPSIMDNLCIGPVKLLGKSRKEAEERAMELLAMVGLAEKADVMPS